jgi:hypothetical protein
MLFLDKCFRRNAMHHDSGGVMMSSNVGSCKTGWLLCEQLLMIIAVYSCQRSKILDSVNCDGHVVQNMVKTTS